MKITDIDKHLKVDTQFEREGLVFRSVLEEPFRIYGVYHDGAEFRRLPDGVAQSTSDAVRHLAKNTAGGRVRFTTDSPYIVIKTVQENEALFSHMPMTGRAGYDLYVFEDGKYSVKKTFVPPYDYRGGYAGAYDFSTEGERNISINFPLYNGVSELYVGIKEGSVLRPAPEYRYEKPAVYYGSSVTQGGCASRPGNSYQGMIERRLDLNYINLGFSGSAKGEAAMADYIASLDMSVFVYDYDYNSQTQEHYEKTHEQFYRTVRAAHPDLPIIIMTRPKTRNMLSPAEYRRIETAKKTYDSAVARGENVRFIPGYELMEAIGDDGLVDFTHPSDLGFYAMAERLARELQEVLAN